jgi:hypothetical protein
MKSQSSSTNEGQEKQTLPNQKVMIVTTLITATGNYSLLMFFHRCVSQELDAWQSRDSFQRFDTKAIDLPQGYHPNFPTKLSQQSCNNLTLSKNST